MRSFSLKIFIFIHFLAGEGLNIQAQVMSDQQLLKDLRYTSFCLADDSMCGRLAGSLYDVKASKIISGCFRQIHLKAVNGKDYFQNFNFPGDSGRMNQSQNVTGRCGNKKGPVIIIGAHYDHIGMGGKLSRNPLKHEVHNGADDNAGGIAIMMELARMISGTKKLNFNYIFTAFSAHECGLYGSRYLAKSGLIDTSQVALMINLDMVGRLDTTSERLFYSCNRSWCDSLLFQTKDSLLILTHKELPQGDHTAFDAAGISVMYFTTGMHDDYHKITDDPERLFYKGMVQITRYLFTLVNGFDKRGCTETKSNCTFQH
jgi:hypothetical protein